MSYCRFSDDSFRCDLYVYEDIGGGYTIHVAAARYDIPDDLTDPMQRLMEIEPGDTAGFEKLAADHNAFLKRLRETPMLLLEAPSAGETFREPTAAACHARMLKLRAEGLRFPDAALAELAEEMAAP